MLSVRTVRPPTPPLALAPKPYVDAEMSLPNILRISIDDEHRTIGLHVRREDIRVLKRFVSDLEEVIEKTERM